MSLPIRYDRADYEWCLDYKQMARRCTTSTGSRDWTREEMMAYLDWSNSEDVRIDSLVAQERRAEPFDAGQRGMEGIWNAVERDIREQESLYAKKALEESCIIVQPE